MGTTGLESVLVSSVCDAVVLTIITLVREAALRLDTVGSNTGRISSDTVGGFEIVWESFGCDFVVQSQDLGVSISWVAPSSEATSYSATSLGETTAISECSSVVSECTSAGTVISTGTVITTGTSESSRIGTTETGSSSTTSAESRSKGARRSRSCTISCTCASSRREVGIVKAGCWAGSEDSGNY